jgi:MiaB-like tRNA modifying enzyme
MVSIYIRTFGCSLNRFDTDVIIYYLVREGFTIVKNPDEADIILVNSCGVKKQTEDRIISYLKKLNHVYGNDKKIVLAGCLPLVNYKRVTKETRVDAMIGPSPGRRIIDVMENVLKGVYYESLDKSIDLYIPTSLIPYNEVTKPVGIASGCLDRCSFCGTWIARGVIKSRPMEDIVKVIRNYVQHGVKEIYLTSLDNGAYGYDLRPRKTIISLLKAIDNIEGEFIVRIGMMNPRWAYRYLDDLIDLFQRSRKFYYFLHIPVQSGSEKMLRIMNRSHGVGEYIECVRRLRREVDEKFTIMTDIIVGHPGETEEDFQATINLMKSSPPDYINISQFFPRPNTVSASMKKVPTHIVKRRSVELSRIMDDIMLRRNRLWLGWRGAILLNEYGKMGRLIGRNYAYRILAIEPNSIDLGDVVYVKVVQAYTTWLYGELHSKASSIDKLWGSS